MIWQTLSENLILTDLTAGSSEEVFRTIGGLLTREGFCRDSYVQALIDREKEYPTGLDMDGIGVAIPHTEVEHVIRPAMAIAVLKKPVPFELMGGEKGETTDVRIVVVLAIRDASEHLDQVKALLKILQDNHVLRQMLDATSAEEVINIVRRKEEQL